MKDVERGGFHAETRRRGGFLEITLSASPRLRVQFPSEAVKESRTQTGGRSAVAVFSGFDVDWLIATQRQVR
jgi:hypothetical protein